MTSINKEVTAIVRSMMKALSKDHGIQVPYTALRAAYLRAQGEHPHAFSRTTQPVDRVTKEIVTNGELRSFVLHLVDDEAGGMDVLALDHAGEYSVPEDFDWTGFRVKAVYARVPRVSRYGLPDHVEKEQEFYPHYFDGMKVANGFERRFDDLGDDSGGDAQVQVLCTQADWHRMLLAVAKSTGEYDVVAEQLGIDHRIDLNNDPNPGQRIEQYLQATGVLPHPENPAQAQFSWVYPDEDGDFREVLVDLMTGALDMQGFQVPAELMHPEVRTRLEFDGECYRIKREASGWSLPFDALAQLRLVAL